MNLMRVHWATTAILDRTEYRRLTPRTHEEEVHHL